LLALNDDNTVMLKKHSNSAVHTSVARLQTGGDADVEAHFLDIFTYQGFFLHSHCAERRKKNEISVGIRNINKDSRCGHTWVCVYSLFYSYAYWIQTQEKTLSIID